MNSISLRKNFPTPRRRLTCLAAFALLASSAGFAQQQQQIADAPAGTPDAVGAGEVPADTKTAPTPAPDSATTLPPTQDKRILGVLPNYRTTDGTVPFQPISWKFKLTIAAKDSFDWPNYIIGGAFAGLYQLENDHPEFGQGVKGYARYYGTSYADQVIGNMLTEGFMPILLHEDPRYFRKVHGSFASRLGYSVTRVLVAKTDHGNPTVNLSEIIGNGMGASISSLYYPTERSFSDVATRWSTQIATDSLSNILKEFWPDIKRHLHKKQTDAQAFADTH